MEMFPGVTTPTGFRSRRGIAAVNRKSWVLDGALGFEIFVALCRGFATEGLSGQVESREYQH